jgi:NAD(P)-dependent dehydrogenase (short-subunit alcohol dehydrogenase family)
MIQAPYNNKVCIVTGGNFGIGKSVSLGFAKRGAKVIIADYFENDDTLIQIKSMGGDATFVKCDVSKDSDVKSMVKKCISTYGQLDYAFNNASMEGSTANLHDCTEENWDRTIALNLKGVWLCMKYEIQEMLKNGKGSIVNNASIAGLIGYPGIPAFVASKHGIIGLTKNAALEYATKNIKVNVVCPSLNLKYENGNGISPWNDSLSGSYLKPVGKLGESEEIAEAAIYLCGSYDKTASEVNQVLAN